MVSSYGDDLALHIQNCMSAEERKFFVDTFSSNNSQYRGSEVADILTILYDTDSHLEVTDAMYEAHTQEIDSFPRGLYGMCVYVAIYTKQGTAWDTLHHLMQRFNHQVG